MDPLDGALERERSTLVATSTGTQIPGGCHGRNLLHISSSEGAGRWVRGAVVREGSRWVHGDWGSPDVSCRAAHSERGIAKKGRPLSPSEPGHSVARSGLTTH